MAATVDPKLFDVRTVERNMARGLVTPEQVAKFRESLPDLAEKTVSVPAQHPVRRLTGNAE